MPFEEQDVPMLHGVADNALIQRLLAGHPDFDLVESLASVGLGMEWGVPEFFSLLLGGMIRWAWRHDVPLTRRHLWVFIAHVQYDVLHAISVVITSYSIHYTKLYEKAGSRDAIAASTRVLEKAINDQGFESYA